MKTELYTNPKIQIRRSSVHGWGVFAKEDIMADEILEEVPFLILPINKGEVSSLMIDYRFNYPSGLDWNHQVLPLGFGCFYNHSENPSALWYSEEDSEIFVFKSTRMIPKGEEIFVYYGDINYWNDGRTNTDLK